VGVLVVAAADVVEAAAAQHLQLQIHQRRLVLARLPLQAGVLGLAGLLSAGPYLSNFPGSVNLSDSYELVWLKWYQAVRETQLIDKLKKIHR